MIRLLSGSFYCFLIITALHSIHAEESSSNSFVENEITESDRDHWAFKKLERPTLPTVQQTDWVQNPIDHFILAKLEAVGLRGLPAARSAILWRRASFDLTGLPPNPDLVASLEQNKAEHNVAPGIYLEYTDQLLNSPAYGERWAQHWLDLVRFAESDGFEHDIKRPDAWKYRQWVIDALNNDLPYDQFISQQLTADLDEDPSNDIATMFCLAGPDMPDINEQDLRRHDKLNEITSMIGAALLGLQTHCAQCHDHKYDAISAADFYRLRGIFESAVPTLKRDKPWLQLAKHQDNHQPALYHRGELSQKVVTLTAKPLRIACSPESYANFDSTEPRTALVEWLFADENPLVARVIANRVWQHHFGVSLTENPSDFGIVYGEPVHRELLDWLSMELIDNNWSIKHLHRVIMSSATYRQIAFNANNDVELSECLLHASKVDPDNKLYSRYPRWRLEGEAIRDALLSVSGKINLQYGGPSVLPPLPQELKSTLLQGHWEESLNAADHHRRSIYVFARRNLRYPIFEAFDRPDAISSCPIRNRSTTAIQSLELLNSDLAGNASRELSERVLRETTSVDNEFNVQSILNRLFVICLSREPTPMEREHLSKYLGETDTRFSTRLRTVCHGILNSNEFIYID